MRSDIRRKLAMAARALDFAQAHPATDASYTALVAKLKNRLAWADQLANMQENGTSGERAAQAHRLEVRDTLELHLRHLVGVASVAAEDHPELKTMFQAPRSGAALKVVITKAKALLEIAVPQKELFASVGMGDTFLDELTAAVNEFDQSTTDAHTGRRDHVGASTDLPVATEDCVKMVKLLNGIYRIRFKKDPLSLGAWNSSRNVAGPFTRSKNGDAAATPIAPDLPVPAAPAQLPPAAGMS